MVAMTRGGGIREHAALRDGVLDVICHDKNMAQQRMPRGTELRGRHGHQPCLNVPFHRLKSEKLRWLGFSEKACILLLLEPLGTLPFGLPQDPTLDPLELDPIEEGGLGMLISNDLSSDCDGLEI